MEGGFTLLEVLTVTALIGIISAVAIPGLLRARQSGNEASAIGSIRAISTGQTTFASTCARGGYAQSNIDLAKAPAGGAAFIGADLEQADLPGHAKSGYHVDISDNAGPDNRDITPAASTCNGSSSNARLNYFVGADPVVRGETGGRSFASDARGAVYVDSAAPVLNPIPAGAEAIR